jgi:hypothetical protein
VLRMPGLVLLNAAAHTQPNSTSAAYSPGPRR